jgi:hypothetical protein
VVGGDSTSSDRLVRLESAFMFGAPFRVWRSGSQGGVSTLSPALLFRAPAPWCQHGQDHRRRNAAKLLFKRELKPSRERYSWVAATARSLCGPLPQPLTPAECTYTPIRQGEPTGRNMHISTVTDFLFSHDMPIVAGLIDAIILSLFWVLL